MNKIIPKNEKVSLVLFLFVCRADSDAAGYIAPLYFPVLLSLPLAVSTVREKENKKFLSLFVLWESD